MQTGAVRCGAVTAVDGCSWRHLTSLGAPAHRSGVGEKVAGMLGRLVGR